LRARAVSLAIRALVRSRLPGEVREASVRALVRSEALSGGPRRERYGEQIKGRNFEVPGCCGFLLTGRADNLEDYYTPGREVATFDSTASLIQQIRYFLNHEDERLAIAAAGYQRTLREHTYVHRFTDIFRRMSLNTPPLEEMLSGQVAPGQTQVVE
jgi:hypothetical protein